MRLLQIQLILQITLLAVVNSRNGTNVPGSVPSIRMPLTLGNGSMAALLANSLSLMSPSPLPPPTISQIDSDSIRTLSPRSLPSAITLLHLPTPLAHYAQPAMYPSSTYPSSQKYPPPIVRLVFPRPHKRPHKRQPPPVHSRPIPLSNPPSTFSSPTSPKPFPISPYPIPLSPPKPSPAPPYPAPLSPPKPSLFPPNPTPLSPPKSSPVPPNPTPLSSPPQPLNPSPLSSLLPPGMPVTPCSQCAQYCIHKVPKPPGQSAVPIVLPPTNATVCKALSNYLTTYSAGLAGSSTPFVFNCQRRNATCVTACAPSDSSASVCNTLQTSYLPAAAILSVYIGYAAYPCGMSVNLTDTCGSCSFYSYMQCD
ncbi:hypothetical protein CEUSTIGMA_g1621.t1 [Chlamydomonas eustigma]|uniref:Pherophorin domain-containing protein n=1 Tax=Chlamydomonas eustigma TaxID=1157962 RepID=A0A250WU67_9CHLO|nr:hypothetical protein CEUSTIGMA_g1621.t1 [Chlamydomonas eustigma]|eukprot:GAX74172.1 hypothetical protein CEUSTIGMA_g1621.t1 [Chlamydomonas eustigma]